MSANYSNERAAKGQAINLAVHDAIAIGRHEDITYIVGRYLHYYELADKLQNMSIEDAKSCLV